MLGVIYCIFCTVNGKSYVGQTWNGLEDRWKQHSKPSYCRKLWYAIRKHGISHFIPSILTSDLTTQEQMDTAERYWIQYFDCHKNGYNIREGGSHGKMSEETKKLMSIAHTGKKRGPMSEDQKAKISATRLSRNIRCPEEQRVRVSRSCGGRPFVDQNGNRYETLRNAAESLGIQIANVSAVLHGRAKSAGGYRFTYIA